MSLFSIPTQLAARSRKVEFPTHPVILRRELEREFGEGVAIRIVREWQCSFARKSGGASVIAQQIRCDVDAPPSFSALADIERKREVTGLFPMQLSAEGLIASWAEGAPIGIASAVSEAGKRIENSTLKSNEKAEAHRYFADIGRTTAELVSQVPRDLFYPEEGAHTQTRKLDLPGGMEGVYEITIEAKTHPRTGLLDYSERRIVTRIHGSSRMARERWSLRP